MRARKSSCALWCSLLLLWCGALPQSLMHKTFSGAALIYWVLMKLRFWFFNFCSSQSGKLGWLLAHRAQGLLFVIRLNDDKEGMDVNVSFDQCICSPTNRQIPYPVTIQKNMLPRSNLTKTNFKMCQLIHGEGTVICFSCYHCSIWVPLTIREKWKKYLPNTLRSWGRKSLSGCQSLWMEKLAGVWNDWRCHTGASLRLWASLGVFGDMKVPAACQTSETELLGGVLGVCILLSHTGDSKTRGPRKLTCAVWRGRRAKGSEGGRMGICFHFSPNLSGKSNSMGAVGSEQQHFGGARQAEHICNWKSLCSRLGSSDRHTLREHIRKCKISHELNILISAMYGRSYMSSYASSKQFSGRLGRHLWIERRAEE